MIRWYTLMFVAMVMVSGMVAQVDSKKVSDDLQKIEAMKADSLPWKLKFSIGGGITTVMLNNWSGGGENTVTLKGLFLGSADYVDDRFSWDNDLDLGYGITKLGSESFRKNDDRIILTSKASIKQTDILRYTAFLDFRTQFYQGLNYDKHDPVDTTKFLKISNLFAPAYLTGALGLEWTPIKEFKMLVSPLSSRSIFVLDDDLSRQGAYGVDSGAHIKTDIGGLINMNLDWIVFENVTWKSRFNAFCRYNAPDLWILTVENAILMKVNSFLSVGFMTDIFYDDRVPVVRDNGTTGPATQVRNQLIVTFQYSMQNF